MHLKSGLVLCVMVKLVGHVRHVIPNITAHWDGDGLTFNISDRRASNQENGEYSSVKTQDGRSCREGHVFPLQSDQSNMKIQSHKVYSQLRVFVYAQH